MKKIYQNPTVEVILFKAVDVVTASAAQPGTTAPSTETTTVENRDNEYEFSGIL